MGEFTMTERYCGRLRSDFFIPTQAILGYSNWLAKKPAVAERRRRYVDFARELHAVLTTLFGCYSLHEELTVLTSAGLAGPWVRADCVAITHIGVFVISRVNWAGRVTKSLEKDKLRVTNAEGMLEFHPCPLQYTSPAVHFLAVLLDDIGCPIESIAISENETCEFGFGLSTSLLKLSELHHFFRARRERTYGGSSPFVNTEEVEERLRIGCGLKSGPTPKQLEDA
jgi:hypothetical protein